MEPELVQLAREAVAALQAANRTSWVDQASVVIAGVQLLVSAGGLACIVWGLAQMQQAGRRRDAEIDKLGHALEQQGAALGQAVRQIGQALERQGRALEELLRRTA